MVFYRFLAPPCPLHPIYPFHPCSPLAYQKLGAPAHTVRGWWFREDSYLCGSTLKSQRTALPLFLSLTLKREKKFKKRKFSPSPFFAQEKGGQRGQTHRLKSLGQQGQLEGVSYVGISFLSLSSLSNCSAIPAL